MLLWGAYGIFGLALANFHSLNLVTLFNTISLIFGNVAIIAISLQSVRRRKQWGLFGYALLNRFDVVREVSPGAARRAGRALCE